MKISGFLMSLLLCLTIFSADGNAQRRGGGRVRGDGSTTDVAKTTSPERTRKQPSGTNLSSDQQANLDKLKSDLNAIKSGSTVTQAQKDALKNSLTALAQGTTKPDKNLVKSLANDLSQALSDGNISQAEKARLADDLQQVLNSANIPAAEVNAAISDARAIFEAANIDSGEVETIVNDLKAIANETKSNFPRRTTPR